MDKFSFFKGDISHPRICLRCSEWWEQEKVDFCPERETKTFIIKIVLNLDVLGQIKNLICVGGKEFYKFYNISLKSVKRQSSLLLQNREQLLNGAYKHHSVQIGSVPGSVCLCCFVTFVIQFHFR